MERLKNQSVRGKHQRPIVTDVAFERNKCKKPLVVFCHGYKGYKDWGAFDLMTSSFVARGCFLVKFNFSHNGGTLAQPIDFPDLKAFGQNNFTKELDDLGSVLDWVLDQDLFREEIDSKRIVLIGHSRGGGIASIKAAEDARITHLVTWASVADFGARFPKGKPLDLWRKEGIAYIENARTGQKMPHEFQFYEDFVKNKERLNIQNAVQKLTIPHLIVHGTADSTVEVEEAKSLHGWSQNSRLVRISGGDHVFGAQQPWRSSKLPADFQKALEQTFAFLQLN
jgi:pimeloyl-ACP methyl ester carboxylesterase